MGTNERRRAVNSLQALILAVVAAAVCFGIWRYSQVVSRPPVVRVVFDLSNGSRTPELRLELATTNAQREHGLMYRKEGELQRDQGMLFIHPRDEDHGFWMMNTYISLDMVFVDKNFKVVGILPDVPILSEKLRSIGRPSRYVLELLAGQAKALGISVGSTMVALDPLPPAS